MEAFFAVFAVIAALALTVTKVVDFIRNLPYFKNADGTPKFVGSWLWNVVAFAVGVVICVGWQHSFANDLIHLVPALANWNLSNEVGYLLSGVMLGALAGVGHEILDAFSSMANRNDAIASRTTTLP